MIVASDLNSEKEKKLVETLIKYKEAIAWSMEHLKGISPSICMHKILMEENAKPSIKSSDEGSSEKGSAQMAQCWIHLCHFK